jgi:hypothetical protein
MNGDKSNNFSSNESVNSSADFTVVTNSHLPGKTYCLKVVFSIALSLNTSSNVFYKLTGPEHPLQLQTKNNLSEEDCKS